MNDLAWSEFSDSAEIYRDAFVSALQFPEDLTVSEWADRHRVLVSVSASEPGEWRTDRTPYLRAILDWLSDHAPGRNGYLMSSSQVGKSECILNRIGYTIHHAPAPMLMVQPTIELGEDFSKNRVQPMIDACPELAERVKSKSRDSGNTVRLKNFPGGMLAISGANSPASLKGRPIKIAVLDEVDEYEDDLADQGGVDDMVRRRQTTFRNRKFFCCSTPTVEGHSLIAKLYESGTMEHYHVPCPHCGTFQVLRFDLLQPSGLYACAKCGALINDLEHKDEMLARGVWIAERPERADRSWHINALYTPNGLGDTWAEIAVQREATLKDKPKLKTFTNQVMGLPYQGDSEKLETKDLSTLKDPDWQAREIPPGCLIVTRAIDVQKDRWAVHTVGHGRNGQFWSIDYVEIPGDPLDHDWSDLEDYVFKPLQTRSGLEMPVSLIGIDSGNWTSEVYRWAKKHAAKKVVALKGSKDRSCMPLARPKKVDVDARGKTLHHGVQFWLVGVHEVKTAVFRRIQSDLQPDSTARYSHFPSDADERIFAHLAAERYDTQANRWIKLTQHTANEAWDTLIYNIALTYHPTIRAQNKREADWLALEARFGVEPEQRKPAPEPQKAEPPKPARAGPKIQQPIVGGGFDRGFR